MNLVAHDVNLSDEIKMEFNSQLTQCFFESEFIDDKMQEPRGALNESKVMQYLHASHYPTLI